MVWLYRTLAAATLVLALTSGHAQDDQDSVGGVADIQGLAVAERDSPEPLALALQDSVFQADLLRTGEDSLLTVSLDDGSWFSMDAETVARMEDYVAGQDALLTMARGRVRVFVSETFSRHDNAFRVQTDDAVIGVQGTFFIITRLIAETTLYVIQGIVSVTSTDPRYPDPVIAQAGQFVRVPANGPPTPPITIDQNNFDFGQSTNPNFAGGQYWGRTFPPGFVVPVPVPVPGTGSGLVNRAIIQGTTPPPPPPPAVVPPPPPPPPAGGAAAPAAPAGRAAPAAGGAAAPAAGGGAAPAAGGAAAPAAARPPPPAPPAAGGAAPAAGGGAAPAVAPPPPPPPPQLPTNRPGPPPAPGKQDGTDIAPQPDPASSDDGGKPPEG